MKKLSIILAALLTGLTAVSVFAADPVVDCYVPEKAATVDGIVEDGEWDGATKLTLNISDTSTWTEGGAGIVGSRRLQDLQPHRRRLLNKPFLHVRRYIYVHPHDT